MKTQKEKYHINVWTNGQLLRTETVEGRQAALQRAGEIERTEPVVTEIK